MEEDIVAGGIAKPNDVLLEELVISTGIDCLAVESGAVCRFKVDQVRTRLPIAVAELDNGVLAAAGGMIRRNVSRSPLLAEQEEGRLPQLHIRLVRIRWRISLEDVESPARSWLGSVRWFAVLQCNPVPLICLLFQLAAQAEFRLWLRRELLLWLLAVSSEMPLLQASVALGATFIRALLAWLCPLRLARAVLR